MSDNKINKNYNREHILDYLHNRMTDRERNAFEREMQKDPFLTDAVEGFSMVDPGDLSADIAELNSKLPAVSSGNVRKLYLSIAASIAILAVVSTVFVTVFLDKTKDIPSETSLSVMETPSLKESDSVEPHTETPSLPEAREPVIPPKISGKRKPEEKSIAMIEESETRAEKTLREDKEEPLAEEVLVLEALIDQSDEELAEYNHLLVTEKDSPAASPKISAFIAEEETTKRMKSVAAGAPVNAGNVSGERRIKGIVIASDENSPLPGATVMFKNTNKGVLTDAGGNFELLIPEQITEPILVVDFIGMEKQEIKLFSDDEVQIRLEPALTALDEVVCIGYGVQKKIATTGAITSISGDELQNRTDYQSAEPVTGYPDFYNYVKQNMKLPENTEVKKAVVVLNFIVSMTGEVSDIIVVKSPSDQFSREAIRLLNEGPAWNPATSGGRKVESGVRIRIVFK